MSNFDNFISKIRIKDSFYHLQDETARENISDLQNRDITFKVENDVLSFSKINAEASNQSNRNIPLYLNYGQEIDANFIYNYVINNHNVAICHYQATQYDASTGNNIIKLVNLNCQSISSNGNSHTLEFYEDNNDYKIILVFNTSTSTYDWQLQPKESNSSNIDSKYRWITAGIIGQTGAYFVIPNSGVNYNFLIEGKVTQTSNILSITNGSTTKATVNATVNGSSIDFNLQNIDHFTATAPLKFTLNGNVNSSLLTYNLRNNYNLIASETYSNASTYNGELRIGNAIIFSVSYYDESGNIIYRFEPFLNTKTNQICLIDILAGEIVLSPIGIFNEVSRG